MKAGKLGRMGEGQMRDIRKYVGMPQMPRYAKMRVNHDKTSSTLQILDTRQLPLTDLELPRKVLYFGGVRRYTRYSTPEW